MFLRLPDASLRTISFGPGPDTVLASNGWSASWEAWEPTFRELSTDWRCLSYDTRGTGCSVAAPDSITLDALVDDVFRVLDEHRVETCVLAGESLGGFVAMHAALRAPARFRALVLVAAPCAVEAELVGARAAAARADYPGTIQAFARLCLSEDGSEHLFEWGERLFLGADPEVAARLFECCYGRAPDLAAIEVPTVVLHGAADLVVPIAAGRALALAIPGAKFLELPGAGHAPTVTRPAEVAAAVRDGWPAPAEHTDIERALVDRRRGVWDDPGGDVRAGGPAVSRAVSTVTVTTHPGACGATVTGVDLADLDDADFAVVLGAWHEHGVVVFPGQHLDEASHVAFSRRLGALENTNTRDPHSPDRRPTSLALSNVDKRGQLVTDPEAKLNRFLRGNQFWHSDSSFKRVSAKASLLAALEVPDEGGETEYADMRAGYDALDTGTRQRLAGLVAVHSASFSQAMAMGSGLAAEEERNLPPVRQPLVRVHEPTGRPSLFIGRHAQRVEQLDEEEGRALLDGLLEAACQPPRVYRHRWSAGDLVLWDNRCMLHRGRPWDTQQARVMRRTTVAGDPPPGDTNEWAL